VRTVPRVIESQARWVVSMLVYAPFGIVWLPVCVSASQDPAVVITTVSLESFSILTHVPLFCGVARRSYANSSQA
jgi:ACR3 family arsenite efflux pump ArsB